MNDIKPQITLDQTTEVLCSNPDCGNNIFTEGLMLRKVSKFLSGTAQDGLIPITITYCVKCNTVLDETLPSQLKKAP